MDMKCSKSKFHEFSLINGWMELYDRQNDKGSEVGYVLKDGCSVLVKFDHEATFSEITDTQNSRISLDDDDNG